MSKRKWDFRDVSNGLKKLREILLGRKHKLHGRFAPLVAPRTIPTPDIPRGPYYKYSDQYYCHRHALNSVKPPVIAPIAEGATRSSKHDAVCFEYAPTPGLPWWWDGHCYYGYEFTCPPPCPPCKPCPPPCPPPQPYPLCQPPQPYPLCQPPLPPVCPPPPPYCPPPPPYCPPPPPYCPPPLPVCPPPLPVCPPQLPVCPPPQPVCPPPKPVCPPPPPVCPPPPFKPTPLVPQAPDKIPKH